MKTMFAALALAIALPAVAMPRRHPLPPARRRRWSVLREDGHEDGLLRQAWQAKSGQDDHAGQT